MYLFIDILTDSAKNLLWPNKRIVKERWLSESWEIQ